MAHRSFAEFSQNTLHVLGTKVEDLRFIGLNRGQLCSRGQVAHSHDHTQRLVCHQGPVGMAGSKGRVVEGNGPRSDDDGIHLRPDAMRIGPCCLSRNPLTTAVLGSNTSVERRRNLQSDEWATLGHGEKPGVQELARPIS
jgi:hypothetical protein